MRSLNFLSMQLDTYRDLVWLRKVKESHGSVELDAISLATAINERGVFVVGKQKGLEPVVCSIKPRKSRGKHYKAHNVMLDYKVCEYAM